jgi:branched-chain amino acid aminotransferase
VVERRILPDEIASANEVFLAGTAAEVTPVRQIGAHHFTPGKITETLLTDYEALVRLPPEEVRRRAA